MYTQSYRLNIKSDMISKFLIAFKTHIRSNMECTVRTVFDILLPITVCDVNHILKSVYLEPKICKFVNFCIFIA